MSFGVKYRCQWTNSVGVSQKIEILEDGYSSSVTDLKGASVPVNFTYNESPYVVGSELIFKFVCSQASVSTYDELFTSAYKNKKLKFYSDGTNLTWVGWIKPENSSREYHTNPLVYSISATDGLNDLNDIDFLDSSGNQYTDKVTILQTIKRCLDLNGIDDNKFYIQCNIIENAIMSTGQTPFNEIYIDNRRFYQETDGEIKPMPAYSVLEECVKIFYCRLYQHGDLDPSNGGWRIVNDQEISSTRIIFDYDLGSSSSGSHNRSLTIDSYLPYESAWNYSKEPPIKNLRVTFRNRNIGGNVMTNGDFSDGLTGWDVSAWNSYSAPSGVLLTSMSSNVTDSSICFTRSAGFGISAYEEGDQIRVKVRVKITSITWAVGGGSYYPSIYVTLNQPTLGDIPGAGYVQSTLDQWITIQRDFPINEAGTFNFQFCVQVYGSVDSMAYNWDDIEVNQIKQVQSTDITTDKLYKYQSNSTGYGKVDIETLFGDSIQYSDAGALTDGSDVGTETWKRYGKTEAYSLLYLLALQYLNDNGAYRAKFNIDIYDPDNNISYETILYYNSTYYKWANYSKDYINNKITGDIVEIFNGSDYIISEESQNLTTVDGHGSSGSTIIQQTDQYWFPSVYGIYTFGRASVGGIPTGNYQFEVFGDQYISGTLATELTASRAAIINASQELDISDTTTTELSYVHGVTSSIQTQIDGKISHSLATAANDFLVASGAGTFVKKTLAETKTILGTSPWSVSGSYVYYNSGNVGIGTATPAQKLSLYDASSAIYIQVQSGAAEIAGAIFKNSVQQWIIYTTSVGSLQFRDQTNTANVMIVEPGATASSIYVNSTGVGIKTAPSTDFDVNGVLRIRGGSPTTGYVLTATDANGNATWQAAPTSIWTDNTTYISYANGILIGNTASAAAGMLRWTGTAFQGYDGSAWNDFADTGTSGLWSLSGSDIYYNSGNVLIGGGSGFYAKLRVYAASSSGTINTLGLFGYDTAANRGIVIEQEGGTSTANQYVFLNGHLGSSATTSTPTITSSFASGFGIMSSDHHFNVITAYPGTNSAINYAISVYTETAAGKIGLVGINTNSPTDTLDVNGTIRIRGGSPAAGYVWTASDSNGNGSWAATGAPTVGNLTATSPISMSATRQLYGGAAVVSMTQAGSGSNGWLSSTDWNTFNNKQSALTTGTLSATSPVAVSGSRTVIGGAAVISIAQATTSTSGYLSSTDWNTFNNKQSALTTGAMGASSPISLSASRSVIGGALTISITKSDSTHDGYLSAADWNTFNAAAGTTGNLTASSPLAFSATRKVIGGTVNLTISDFTSSSKGAVPNPGSSTGRFLKDDGNWSYIGGTSGFSSEELIVTQEADQLIDHSISAPEISLYMAASMASSSTYAYKVVVPYTVNEADGSVPCASFSMMGLFNTSVTYHTQKVMIFDNNGSYDYWVHFYYTNSTGVMSSPGSQLSGSEIFYAVLEGVVKTSGSGTLYIYFGYGLTGTVRTVKIKEGAFLAYRRVL